MFRPYPRSSRCSYKNVKWHLAVILNISGTTLNIIANTFDMHLSMSHIFLASEWSKLYWYLVVLHVHICQCNNPSWWQFNRGAVMHRSWSFCRCDIGIQRLVGRLIKPNDGSTDSNSLHPLADQSKHLQKMAFYAWVLWIRMAQIYNHYCTLPQLSMFNTTPSWWWRLK